MGPKVRDSVPSSNETSSRCDVLAISLFRLERPVPTVAYQRQTDRPTSDIGSSRILCSKDGLSAHLPRVVYITGVPPPSSTCFLVLVGVSCQSRRMTVSSNVPPRDIVTEKQTTIRESRAASTEEHPNNQVIELSTENAETKDAAEQSTSLKDYFVCLVYGVGIQCGPMLKQGRGSFLIRRPTIGWFWRSPWYAL